MIGPNGAGKTVLMNVINGIYTPDNGNIFLNGHSITGTQPERIARLGVGRSFQIPKVFRNMTVLENLLVAGSAISGEKSLREIAVRASQFLDLIKMTHMKDELAKTLSGGQQKLLEFARALIMEPTLFLADEPFAGVNPVLVEVMMNVIRFMRERDVSVIIVSHEMALVASLCGRVIALDRGQKIAEGPMKEVVSEKKVSQSYLGE